MKIPYLNLADWVLPDLSAAAVSSTTPPRVSTAEPKGTERAVLSSTKARAPGSLTRTLPLTGASVAVSPRTGGAAGGATLPMPSLVDSVNQMLPSGPRRCSWAPPPG